MRGPAWVAIAVAIIWTVTEAAARRAGADLGQRADTARAGDLLAVLVVFPALAAAAVFVARRQGAPAAWWRLERSRSRLRTGAIGGLVVLAVAGAVGLIDRAAFGQDPAVADALSERFGAWWVVLLLLVVNGVVGPIAEEIAWRGVVQPSFTAVAGVTAGVVVTAGLFSLKHAVVDASPGRLFSLFGFGVAIGVVRVRSGMTAAAAAHVTANLAATSGFLIAQSG